MSVLSPQHQRVGAHRARRNPLATTVTAAVIVVGLSALLLWGVVSVLSGGGDDVAAGSSLPVDGGGASADPQATASAPVVVPSTEAAVPSVAASPSVPPAPVVDKTVAVTVLNGGVQKSGVARGTAERLVTEGWTGVELEATTNAPGYPGVATTQVLYSDPTLAATAAALVPSLTVGAPQQGDVAATGATTPIVVILGADFPIPAT